MFTANLSYFSIWMSFIECLEADIQESKPFFATQHICWIRDTHIVFNDILNDDINKKAAMTERWEDAIE